MMAVEMQIAERGDYVPGLMPPGLSSQEEYGVSEFSFVKNLENPSRSPWSSCTDSVYLSASYLESTTNSKSKSVNNEAKLLENLRTEPNNIYDTFSVRYCHHKTSPDYHNFPTKNSEFDSDDMISDAIPWTKSLPKFQAFMDWYIQSFRSFQPFSSNPGLPLSDSISFTQEPNCETENETKASYDRDRTSIPLCGPPGHTEGSRVSPIVSNRDQRGGVPCATTTRTTTARVTTTRMLKGLVVAVTLLLISPVTGHYDRGGHQHRITWGRGNSPSSAVFGNEPSNVTVVVGHRARLPCTVKNLGLKDVSWIRQRDLHILTVGIFTYTSDDRFKVFHPPETEEWFLDISSVTFRDAGVYECQVSTSPKVSLPITLNVLGVQQAAIPGPREVFIQHGSTISLQCEVQAGVEAVGPVHWLRGAVTLNYSSPRGGISMEVEKTPSETKSKLYITRARRPDSGNYTCAPQYARPDSVMVHVVNDEESAAAVHSGVREIAATLWVMIWSSVITIIITSISTPPPH